MSKQEATPAEDKRPPLEDYIAAAMPCVRLVAKIEREADIVPGSIIESMIEGCDEPHESPTVRGKTWAFWIAGGYAHEDGSDYTTDERDALAVQLARVFSEESAT